MSSSSPFAAYRPTGKGRVERQALIVRDHVLSGRAFSSLEEMDAAFATWVPQRRDQIHKTHREVIGERAARDHAALKSLPSVPHLGDDLLHVDRAPENYDVEHQSQCPKLIFLTFSVGLPELAFLTVEDLPGEVVAGLLPSWVLMRRRSSSSVKYDDR